MKIKTINKIYLVILIVCGLFIVGDNNYFDEAFIIGGLVTILYFSNDFISKFKNL